MPNVPFSDAFLRSIAPPPTGQIDYWDASFSGGCFGCRVSQGGAKTFVLKKDNRRQSLGRFPHISLARAREAARVLLAERTLGRVRPHAVPYTIAVERFIEDKRRNRRPKTCVEYERLLRRLKFPSALCEITHHEAQRQLGRVTAPSEYNHALVVAKVFFNWCRKRHLIEHNPLDGLSQNSTKTRDRVLTTCEIKRVWETAHDLGKFGIIVRLLILTGQRRGEVAALRPAFFKDRICTLPESVTKNKREHSFPIGDLSASVLPLLITSSRTAFFFLRAVNPSTRLTAGQKVRDSWMRNPVSNSGRSTTSGARSAPSTLRLARRPISPSVSSTTSPVSPRTFSKSTTAIATSTRCAMPCSDTKPTS